jgi:hypothetical protein
MKKMYSDYPPEPSSSSMMVCNAGNDIKSSFVSTDLDDNCSDILSLSAASEVQDLASPDTSHIASPVIDVPSVVQDTKVNSSSLISGQSVTRNLPSAIRKSYSYHRLLVYCTRLQWSKTIVDSIEWDDFSAAFQSCFKQRNFAFKFCYRTRYDHPCPACNEPQECNHHLFQCTAVSRQRWRNKTTSTLRKRLDATTDPKLSDIMTAGLCSYFQSKPLDCSEFEKYNATYHNLIRLQESIGWGHFLRGKISKEWANLQQDYIYRTSPGTKFDKDKWLRLIIKPLIMDCLDLWTLRNAERQGNDSASKQQKLANQAQRDLRAIYQLQDEVLASDRDLFSTPLDTFLLADTYSIQCWIRSHKPIIYQSRREANRHAVINVRLLPTYFHPLPSR